MANQGPLYSITRLAGADLSAKRYYLAKLDANGKAVLAGAGEPALGVISYPEEKDRPVTIDCLGRVPVIYGGEVTAGDELTVDAAGKAVAVSVANPDVASFGYALESGAAGELHAALIMHRGAPATVEGLTKAHHTVTIPIELSEVAESGDLVTGLVLGYAGTIKKVMAIVQEAGEGADASVAFNLEIGATDVTGGIVTAALAGTATVGTVIAGSAVTAKNVLAADSQLSIEAVVTTAFTAGRLLLVITIEEAAA